MEYKSFEELAQAMTDGDGELHSLYCAEDNSEDNAGCCISWQRGVLSFAEWLDSLGIKVEVTNVYKNITVPHKNDCRPDS